MHQKDSFLPLKLASKARFYHPQARTHAHLFTTQARTYARLFFHHRRAHERACSPQYRRALGARLSPHRRALVRACPPHRRAPRARLKFSPTRINARVFSGQARTYARLPLNRPRMRAHIL
jgi:hypothetical protein